MHDNLRHHTEKEEFEETEREAKIGPIMTVLHYFKAVTLEVDLAIKIHLVKCFHWNSVSA
jgi:hypothetical protein